MVVKTLTLNQRSKEDNNDDAYFYSTPRFVHHLDEGFRSRLTELYRERISSNSTILDLMSSWVSHLPNDIKFNHVIGHGMNRLELDRNNQLNKYWVQNLNKCQKLPLEDETIDTCLIVAGWQYLQEPEEIAAELKRVTKNNGQLIVSFSNRAFWTKAPRIWIEGDDNDHINYIKSILSSQGWEKVEHLAEKIPAKGFQKIFTDYTDPFFSVIARK